MRLCKRHKRIFLIFFIRKADLSVGPFHVFFVQDLFFAKFAKIRENLVDKGEGSFVCVHLVSVSAKMSKCHLGGVAFSAIDLRGGKLVAHAFHGEFIGNERRYLAVLIHPVFEVMAVAPLVMQPCQRKPSLLAANGERRAPAVKIFCALKELHGREF